MSSDRAEVILPLSDLGVAPAAPRRITIPTAPPDASDASAPPVIDLPLLDLNGSSLDDLLAYAVRAGASDLILAAGSVASVRVDGLLTAISGGEQLEPTTVEEMLSETTPDFSERLAGGHQFRCAYTTGSGDRFRVEVFEQRSGVAATFRVVPSTPPELSALGLASVLDHIAELASGLVIIAGPVGSGRSTTMAAIVAAANRSRKSHIVTIEDPIEVVHASGTCVVSQREVGADVGSTAEGLASAGRLGADIVVVEIGDLVEFELALAAAESGQLVLASSTGVTVRGVIERLVEMTTVRQQPQLRARLSSSLQAIMTQVLCASTAGPRIPATEVLVATAKVRELVRDGRLDQLSQAMVEGAKVEMHTLNQELAQLVRDGRISDEVALERCSDATELRRYLGAAS